jgi:hypothetical protein
MVSTLTWEIVQFLSFWLFFFPSWKDIWRKKKKRHKAILLLRFQWTMIIWFLYHSKRQCCSWALSCDKHCFYAISFCHCNVDWFASSQMNHKKEERKNGWKVYSFMAVFPLYTTLNGSTINCIIKELINLLISTIWGKETNVYALFFPARGQR